MPFAVFIYWLVEKGRLNFQIGLPFPLTGPRGPGPGPPVDCLPRLPMYAGVKSGPTFITRAGSAGRIGVALAYNNANN